MKVEITEGFSNEYGFEMLTSFQLKTPTRRIYAYDMNECPEDATLSRDLSFVFSIEDIIREAHEAGTKGIPLEFIYTKEVE